MTMTTDFRVRVADLPKLAETFGPAYTLGRIATRAVKQAGGASRVNWDQVHKAMIVEAIEQHGQDPDEIHAALSKHSPGAISADKQDQLRQLLDQLGPGLSQRYDQARARQDAEYAAQKAANSSRIKFMK